MPDEQNTAAIFPPSPYGIYFELKTDRFQLEEATRSGSFDMKYRHYHSTYEIYYLLEGNRYHFIDRNIFFVQPGSLVFIAKNRIHKTSPAEQHFHRRFLIEIEESVMEQWFTEMAGGRLCSLFTDEMSILTLTADQQSILNAKLDAIKQEAAQKKESYEEMIEYLLREILLFSFRIKSENNAAHAHMSSPNLIGTETEKIRTVNRVAGYLADHYQESSSLDELASRFFTNKFYLTRIFKQVTGFTIREYLHIQRVQKAQEFLRTSLLPITEIAMMVGFENVSYFEKIFRRYCMQSPREYRMSQRLHHLPSDVDAVRSLPAKHDNPSCDACPTDTDKTDSRYK